MCIAQSAAEIVLARRAGRDSKILLSRVSALSRERDRGGITRFVSGCAALVGEFRASPTPPEVKVFGRYICIHVYEMSDTV